MRKVLNIFLCCFLLAGLAFTQSTTEGAIGGTVFDSSGAVVPNAKVVVHNNATNAEQTATANSSGDFRVTNLASGSYTVTATQTGFATFKAQNVIVQVGSLTEITPRLTVGGGQTTVEVSSEAPQINYTSNEVSDTLNQVAVDNLPINGGRWSEFTLLTPTAVSDSSGFGLISFRGMSTLLNNNTVDGADNNQAFFSEERGRTRAGYSTAKVAVEEFQVNTSNYSAEYGRSAGAVINTVTKTGGNAIHGEAYFYDRNQNWGARNGFTNINVQTLPGVFTPVNFKPSDVRYIGGFGVGGSFIKDKLFWYFAWDGFHRNFPGTAITSNPNVFFAAPSTTTINTLAARLGVTSPQAQTIYNNDLAGLVSMLGPVPRKGDQEIFFPKIDWQVNQKNHVSVAVNRMRWASPAGIQTQATNTNGIASFGNDFVKDTWGVLKIDSLFTSNLSNEARLSYGRDFEFENGQQPTPYEVSNLLHTPTFTNPLGLPPNVSITNGFSFGLPTFLLRPAFPDETRFQWADTMILTHGKHTLKFGFDASRVSDNSQNLRNQFGSFSYSSLLNYFSDLNKPNTCVSGSKNVPCYTSFTQAFGPIGFEFSSTDVGFFIQDDWKVASRLTLNLGLRYEHELLPAPFPGLVNPALPQTATMPNDANNFGPRVGFAWSVFGDNKTVVRGGYGVYYGRIINSTIFNALTSTAVPGSQLQFTLLPTVTSNQPCVQPFPVVLSAAPTCPGAKPSATFFDSHFQAPQIRQADLTVERDLGWGTVLSVSYLGSYGRQLPNFADVNIAPSIGNITYNVVGGGPLNVSTLTEPLFTQRINPNFQSLTDIFSGAISNYQALAVQVNHRLSHSIQFSANYTWAHAIDTGVNGTTFSDTNDLLVPGNSRAEYGNSIYDVPNRFTLNAVIQSPWKVQGAAGYLANDWQIAPIFTAQNGLPFSLTTAGTPPTQPFGSALGSSVNGSGGANRIDVLGRNTFRFPNTYIVDLRVAKKFTMHDRYKIELSGDIFNLPNHQNVTGITSTGYIIGNNAATCGSVALSPCLALNSGFNQVNNSNSNFIYTPRQIQLGARFQF
ncbi:MAG TPA: carboxypeptidase regulatory-like domain-containing protein [Candidatus Angelobacter sp.]|jgi:hypothetical protein|nr:carboxypeptidase regulatory-like domain-containing protein [Candidatus Angelobacter sp.]